MAALIMQPLFVAVGSSLIYLLGGGGPLGAIIILFVTKMFRK
jgi:hypothetical protein